MRAAEEKAATSVKEAEKKAEQTVKAAEEKAHAAQMETAQVRGEIGALREQVKQQAEMIDKWGDNLRNPKKDEKK
ncbi:hypothetical protein [Paenibacillus paridis]|uniref:hypothetical protein n=1 Tax=Paenibacillus paridis TaxID=2583376 RepID=UPI00111E107C|nr:hypothetical protein [Paenibacillus paridis]